jgi:hypothetical protein
MEANAKVNAAIRVKFLPVFHNSFPLELNLDCSCGLKSCLFEAMNSVHPSLADCVPAFEMPQNVAGNAPNLGSLRKT